MKNITNYINGEWLPDSQSNVPLNDGGFLLGDGLFETIRFQDGRLFKPEKHLQRLRSGLNTIHINFTKPTAELIVLLEEMFKRNDITSGLLRLMVTRGEIVGPPWKFSGPPSIYITIRPLTSEPSDPVKVVFYSEEKYPLIRFNPAIKSLNYIGNMMAKKDAENEGAYEPVFYNRDGFVTECAIRNVFFIKGQKLLTPGTDLGVLPGVMRSTIMELAPDFGLTFEEKNIALDSINEMEEAFVSSTGIGLLPCFWDGWNSDFNMTFGIKQKLDTLIRQA